MADKYECDHCGKVEDITRKAGQLKVEEVKYNGSVKFPSVPRYTHDLCKACFGRICESIANVVRRKALPGG